MGKGMEALLWPVLALVVTLQRVGGEDIKLPSPRETLGHKGPGFGHWRQQPGWCRKKHKGLRCGGNGQTTLRRVT